MFPQHKLLIAVVEVAPYLLEALVPTLLETVIESLKLEKTEVV